MLPHILLVFSLMLFCQGSLGSPSQTVNGNQYTGRLLESALGINPCERKGRKKPVLGRGEVRLLCHLNGDLSLWGALELECLCTIVSSWGAGTKALYSPCQPLFGSGLPSEGSLNLCEETLQPRPLTRELIVEDCLLAALQQLGNKTLSSEKGILVALGDHSFHSSFFVRVLELVQNGLGDGSEFPGMGNCLAVFRILQDDTEEKLVLPDN